MNHHRYSIWKSPDDRRSSGQPLPLKPGKTLAAAKHQIQHGWANSATSANRDAAGRDTDATPKTGRNVKGGGGGAAADSSSSPQEPLVLTAESTKPSERLKRTSYRRRRMTDEERRRRREEREAYLEELSGKRGGRSPRPDPPGPRLRVVLVDGYNAIGATRDLSQLARISIEDARVALNRMAEAYGAMYDARVYVVYDAMGHAGPMHEDRLVRLGSHATAVYSKLSEADTYIGAAARHWKRQGAHDVMVVSNDRHVQELAVDLDWVSYSVSLSVWMDLADAALRGEGIGGRGAGEGPGEELLTQLRRRQKRHQQRREQTAQASAASQVLASSDLERQLEELAEAASSGDEEWVWEEGEEEGQDGEEEGWEAGEGGEEKGDGVHGRYSRLRNHDDEAAIEQGVPGRGRGWEGRGSAAGSSGGEEQEEDLGGAARCAGGEGGAVPLSEPRGRPPSGPGPSDCRAQPAGYPAPPAAAVPTPQATSQLTAAGSTPAAEDQRGRPPGDGSARKPEGRAAAAPPPTTPTAATPAAPPSPSASPHPSRCSSPSSSALAPGPSPAGTPAPEPAASPPGPAPAGTRLSGLLGRGSKAARLGSLVRSVTKDVQSQL